MILNYRLLLPLILICTAFSTNAEERWFEVELLLFQRNIDIQDVKEDLATENITIDSTTSISILKKQLNNLCVAGEPCLHKKNPVLITSNQFDSQGNSFQLLDKDKLQLSPQREKLKSHASFTPLLHLTWRMPVESRNKAKPIHIFAGENFAFNMQQRALNKLAAAEKPADSRETDSETVKSEELEQTTEDNLVDIPQAPLLTDKWSIDGNFKIYLDHYLFIDSQLVIRQETTQDIKQPETELTETFEVLNSENDVEVIKQTETEESVAVTQETVVSEVLFDQSRRLRSEEIHYLDHPLMGIIVQIRKIPVQQQTVTEE